MREKLKCLIWFLLVFCIFAIGAELMADDYDGPKIENFMIGEEEGNIKINFSFSDVKGGLESSTFTIGYVIKRNETIVETNAMSDLIISPDPKAAFKVSKVDNGENGEFTASMPFFKVKQPGLKSGDKIKYLIFLTDSSGRKSNIIIYEFTFVEKWDI